MKISLLLLTSFTSISILSSAKTFANVDKDFKICAETALSQKQLSAQVVKVNLNTKWPTELDHNDSNSIREYRMHLGTISGKKLGSVACTFNQQGQLESVSYLSKL